jgi:hypothetical protein
VEYCVGAGRRGGGPIGAPHDLQAGPGSCSSPHLGHLTPIVIGRTSDRRLRAPSDNRVRARRYRTHFRVSIRNAATRLRTRISDPKVLNGRDAKWTDEREARRAQGQSTVVIGALPLLPLTRYVVHLAQAAQKGPDARRKATRGARRTASVRRSTTQVFQRRRWPFFSGLSGPDRHQWIVLVDGRRGDEEEHRAGRG